MTLPPATVASGLAPARVALTNGTVLIVQETAFSPAVTINMAIRAGSLEEPDDRPGLAWFLSRVIDRGTTPSISPRHSTIGEWRSESQRIGTC
jgi:predicted Zn-dependent peptidase